MTTTERFAFEWVRPRVTVYWAARRRVFGVTLNRYPGVFIGVAVQVGIRVFSLVWGRPGRRVSRLEPTP